MNFDGHAPKALTALRAPHTAIRYRADIDGLRAIAILLVLIVHTFPDYLKNGFIGVDIFFVLSGFLITSIVAKELAIDSFSIVDFYIRRANRIFPVLILTLAACLFFGWLSMFASEYQLLGRSAFAGAAFSANINAYLEGGYWDISAKLKPLLHLWSLGVEEQFYLFWPLMLLAVWSRRSWLVAAIAVVFTASLIWNLWCIHIDQPATFYLPFSRIWELAAGGILALSATRPGLASHDGAPAHWKGNILATFGFGLIAAALILPIPPESFPGIYAILPVAGTILLIAAGSAAWLNKTVLANRLPVYIGLISFPLYMWHYPVLVFARILENGDIEPSIIFTCLAITVALSVATYHLIETPIRRNTKRRGAVAIILTILLAASGVGGLLVFAGNGLEWRYTGILLSSSGVLAPPVKADAQLVVIGDSNAAHLAPWLSATYGTKGTLITSAGWPYLVGTIYRPDFPRHPSLTATPAVTEVGLKKLFADPLVDVVILSNQYVMYTSQDLLADQASPTSPEKGAAAYERGMTQTVKELVERGKKVIIFKSIPTRGDVSSVLACSSAVLPIPRRRPTECSRPAADIRREREEYDRMLERIVAAVPNVWLFDSLPFLCDAQYCYIERDGVLLYGDMSHVTPAGSKIIGRELSNLVEQIRAGTKRNSGTN